MFPQQSGGRQGESCPCLPHPLTHKRSTKLFLKYLLTPNMETGIKATRTMHIDLEKLLPWSEGKLTDTKRGLRFLRKAEPTPDFWALWNSPQSKTELVAKGVSLGKDYKTGQFWEVCWWGDPPRDIIRNQEILREASRALDADIEIPCPPDCSFRPYQKAGIDFALKRFSQNLLNGASPRGGVLFADEMGLGKTLEAIGVINSIPTIKTGLVVCPSSVKIHWYRELKKWLVRPATVWMAEPSMFPATDFVIINYDLLRKFYSLIHKPDRWDIVILDEAHNFKSRKAVRTKCIMGYQPSKTEDVEPMPPLMPRIRVAVTGTPMPNEPAEIFPILQWLDPITFNNYWRFVYKFCGAEKGDYGLVMDAKMVNFNQLQDKLRTTVMVRRLKRDVLKELPPKTREIVEFESGDKAIAEEREAYNSKAQKIAAMEANMELLKASGDKNAYEVAAKQLSADVALIFEEIAQLRMKVAQVKLPFVLEYITERIGQGEKIVSFCFHRFLIEALAKAVPGSVIHYGGMSDAEKQISVDRFMQDDKCMLFSGSIGASREGITLTASSHAVFPELDWRPGIVCQCEDRVHRISQSDPVLISHLVLKDSLDSNMVRTILDKQAVLDEALDEQYSHDTAISAPSSNHITVELGEYERKANSLIQSQVLAIHKALQIISGVCDGAITRDGQGFNGCDTLIGKSLASMRYLTNRQALLGQKIVRKYSRQIPAELMKEIV